MVIVDVETTGTDPNKHSLVSIGAVEFERPDRQFYEECRIWDGAHMDPEALQINGLSESDVTDPSKQTEAELVANFSRWTEGCTDLVIAGQNVFFDMRFIEQAALRAGVSVSFSRRIVDNHSITYYHMRKRRITPPLHGRKTNLDSDTIMAYVGIPVEPKPHNGLNGAIWEAEALHRLMFDKPLFDRFKIHAIPWL
jgi:DNA polymerase III epsilon subunit-like protein